MTPKVRITTMEPDDWPAVRLIYCEGIATGHATFETDAPSWDAWSESHLEFGRLVARNEDRICGWAALSPVSQRRVYAGVAEVSVYVAEDQRHQGIGSALLRQLVITSEQHGVWTLQAVMFPENAATIALHQRCGFRKVGRRERIGKLNGVWRDTILLERRSPQIVQ